MHGLSHSQQAALDAMGITRWHRQITPAPALLQILSAGQLKDPEAKLLDAMLAAIDLHIGADVRLASSVDNALAQKAPSPFWLVLGAEAAAALWGSLQPLDNLRGNWHSLDPNSEGESPVVLVTETPAALLRTPTAKASVWEDLRRLRRALQEAA